MTDSEIKSMLQDILCDQGLRSEMAQNEAVSEAQYDKLVEVVKRHLPKPPEPEKVDEKRLFVGNLSYDTSDDDLRDWFEVYGDVQSAWIVTDRETGRSKGFGFVEMNTEVEAQAAVKGVNGKSKNGRVLTVNLSRPKTTDSSKQPFKKRKWS